MPSVDIESDDDGMVTFAVQFSEEECIDIAEGRGDEHLQRARDEMRINIETMVSG